MQSRTRLTSRSAGTNSLLRFSQEVFVSANASHLEWQAGAEPEADNMLVLSPCSSRNHFNIAIADGVR